MTKHNYWALRIASRGFRIMGLLLLIVTLILLIVAEFISISELLRLSQRGNVVTAEGIIGALGLPLAVAFGSISTALGMLAISDALLALHSIEGNIRAIRSSRTNGDKTFKRDMAAFQKKIGMESPDEYAPR